MPTVTYKCPDSGKNKKRKFAYNAVGKAQSDAFARLRGGKLKMNPGPKEEAKTKSTSHKNIVRKKANIETDEYRQTKDTTATEDTQRAKQNAENTANIAKQIGGVATTLGGVAAKKKKS